MTLGDKFDAKMKGKILRSEYEELLRKYNLLVRFLKDKGILDDEIFEKVSDSENQNVLNILAEKSENGKCY